MANAQSITGCGGQRVNFKNLNYRIPVNAIVILSEVERGAVALLEYRHLPT